jgi:hypothetical protein
MNALNEPQVIARCTSHRRPGVKIDLIVRGAGTLRPGVPGVSDNIRVLSIVGRFLEHHRVYWYANDGAPELFCSSADWLERNLLRRIETGFPILDPELAARVYDEALANYLADNCNAWELQSDGTYRKVAPDDAHMPHSAAGEPAGEAVHVNDVLARPRATALPLQDGDLLAAVDLGSNSFHMVVARQGARAACAWWIACATWCAWPKGSTAKGGLTPEVRQRALESLERFGQRIRDIPPWRVRADRDEHRAPAREPADLPAARRIRARPCDRSRLRPARRRAWSTSALRMRSRRSRANCAW